MTKGPLNAQEFVNKLHRIQYFDGQVWRQLHWGNGAWRCPVVTPAKMEGVPTLNEVLESRASRGETMRDLATESAALRARIAELEGALHEAQAVLVQLITPDMRTSALHVYSQAVVAEAKARAALAKAGVS